MAYLPADFAAPALALFSALLVASAKQFATAEADTSLTAADKEELARSKSALLDTFDKLSKTSKDMYEMALTVRDLACTVGI